jgi:hypothetical protein
VAAVVALAVINPFSSAPSRPHVTLTANPVEAPTSPTDGAYLGAEVEPQVLADSQIKALVYFGASPPGRGSYSLGDAAAMSAFRSIAQQPYFNPAGAP